MQDSYKGVIFILISALGFGLIPIFALFAYQSNINVATLLVLRFTFGAGLFFLYAYVKYKSIYVSGKELLFLFILGSICYNLQSTFYFTSVQFISASLAALFLYTYPMIVTTLSLVIDKTKINKMMAISLTVSFLGLVLILGTSVGSIDHVGVGFALGAALVYSIYIILGNKVVKKTPPLLTSAYIALFAALGILINGWYTDSISFQFSSAAWLPIAGIVLFSTVLAMLSFFKGLELLGPSHSSILSMVEPFFTVIASTLILQERLTLLQLTGGVLVVAGAALAIRYREL